MARKKIAKTYAVYWRNPETRVFEALPGASVVTIQGKPKMIQSDIDGSMVRIK